jgi:hypothetical protein
VEGSAVAAEYLHSALSIQVAILPETNRPPLVIPTGAYPDFLLRAASDVHVCGSL